MQRREILKYILDIESIINELELIIQLNENDYSKFSSSFLAIRAVERDLMIIGEAISKLKKMDSEIAISSAKHIIGLRNMIVHAYDSIDPTTLWRIIIKDVPVLKNELETIKG